MILVKKIFGAKVINSDLSEEACKRAREIFNIEADSADIHHLSHRDNEFDVVLCSETLEHTANPKKGINELLRVAKKAVVITVPYESQKAIKKNNKDEVPHAHLHNFNLNSFDYLKLKNYQLFKKRMVNSLLRIPMILIGAQRKENLESTRYPKVFIEVYNFLVPVLERIFGKKSVILLVKLNDFICKFIPFHHYILFVILKDKNSWNKKNSRKISFSEVLNIIVPYHYLR